MALSERQQNIIASYVAAEQAVRADGDEVTDEHRLLLALVTLDATNAHILGDCIEACAEVRNK